MKQDINFTKSEAAALRNITKILISYTEQKHEHLHKEVFVGLKVLVTIHQALDEGETQIGFSDNITEFLIHVINFWYEGVGRALYNSEALRGTVGNTFKKHYKLVPGIIKKLKQYETKNLQTAAR